MKDNKELPKWDKTQIEGQKKINRRLTIRTAALLVIVLIVIIIAIIVGVASNNKNATPQKPSADSSVQQIEKYEKSKFSDNNASSINSISLAKSNRTLLVKVDNVDVSTQSSASNSFSQMADELQSVGTYDVAKNGVIFYNSTHDFAIYFNQKNIESLNSNYSDYLGSGNYPSLFSNSNSYKLKDSFKNSNKKLSKIPNSKSPNIINESFK